MKEPRRGSIACQHPESHAMTSRLNPGTQNAYTTLWAGNADDHPREMKN
jgi:hypothetical protein